MNDKKSQNPLTRRNIVLDGAAAIAGVTAAIPEQERVVAQESSEDSQQQTLRSLVGRRTGQFYDCC